MHKMIKNELFRKAYFSGGKLKVTNGLIRKSACRIFTL